MKIDRPAKDVDSSTMPGEFGSNYRFLSELINCKEKNDSALVELEALVDSHLRSIRGRLNRRQLAILNHFIKGGQPSESECLTPPVPEELEASIRVRKRASWLPWEAEAIRKIDLWRTDILCIKRLWTGGLSVSPCTRTSNGCSRK